jgi:hypothetical protein
MFDMISNTLLLTLGLLLCVAAPSAAAQSNSVSLALDQETRYLLHDLIKINSQSNTFAVKLDDETRNILREATGDKWFKKELFFSSLLGAAVAVIAGYVLHRIGVCQKSREDDEFVHNVLKSIEAELDTLSDIFNRGIGGKLKARTGRMFLVRLALSQDYFTVFGANAVHLGKINPKTARAIISLYQTLKELIEAFRINNEYIQMHDAVLYQMTTTFASRPDGIVQRASELERSLNDQGDELVRLTQSVEQQYRSLKETFNKPNIEQ